jgi:hypothetical protein
VPPSPLAPEWRTSHPTAASRPVNEHLQIGSHAAFLIVDHCVCLIVVHSAKRQCCLPTNNGDVGNHRKLRVRVELSGQGLEDTRQTAFKFEYGIDANNCALDRPVRHAWNREVIKSVLRFDCRIPQLVRQGSEEIRSYLEAESLFNMAIASCTVVINCAGKMMVEFFSVAISAIVCSVRS